MDKKATIAYIQNLTNIEVNYLIDVLRYDKSEFLLEALEKILDNKDAHRYIWNHMWLPRSMTMERIVDYVKYDKYPKFQELLKGRLKAYWDIEDGEYVHKEFSSERLKYVPFFYMSDSDLREKLDKGDWESYYVVEIVEDDPYGDLRNRLNHYCVIEKDTENRVGIVAIETESPTKRDWNVSYMIAKEYRGRCYAQEAVKAIIEAVKNKHIFGINCTRYVDVFKKYNNCRSIVGIAKKENIISQKVLEKCGFEKTTNFNREGYITYSYNLK